MCVAYTKYYIIRPQNMYLKSISHSQIVNHSLVESVQKNCPLKLNFCFVIYSNGLGDDL